MGTEEEVAITSLLSVFTAKKNALFFITNNTNSRFFFPNFRVVPTVFLLSQICKIIIGIPYFPFMIFVILLILFGGNLPLDLEFFKKCSIADFNFTRKKQNLPPQLHDFFFVSCHLMILTNVFQVDNCQQQQKQQHPTFSYV